MLVLCPVVLSSCHFTLWNASIVYYFYYDEIDCFIILQGKSGLEENNQDSLRALIPTTPVTTFTFTFGTSAYVARSCCEQYIYIG